MLQDTSIVTGRAHALSRWLGTGDLTAQPPGIPQPPPDFPPSPPTGPDFPKPGPTEPNIPPPLTDPPRPVPRPGEAPPPPEAPDIPTPQEAPVVDPTPVSNPPLQMRTVGCVALKAPRTSQLSVDFLRQMIRKENGLPAIAPPKASVIDIGKQ